MLDCGVAALQLASKALSENGIAVYERDRPFSGTVGGLELTDERKYGRTVLSFFKRNNL